MDRVWHQKCLKTSWAVQVLGSYIHTSVEPIIAPTVIGASWGRGHPYNGFCSLQWLLNLVG